MNHVERQLLGEEWADLLGRISGGRDLNEWARTSGAIQRSRKVKDGEALLRLALVYGGCGKSLPQTSLWAASQGLADLSDEALLKRLANSADWLGEILSSLLLSPVSAPSAFSAARPLRLIDGTTISAPGAKKPTWRLIVSFDPQRQATVGLDLKPAGIGERLDRVTLLPGELAITDRGFARPQSLRYVRDCGADFLVRLGSRSLRLLDEHGRLLERQALLDQAAIQGGLDRGVLIANSRQAKWTPVRARLVILPLPDHAIQSNQRKLRRAGQREGYAPSAIAQEASRWLILLTSLDSDEFPPASVGELYRLRWQIELAIKRYKSLGHLGQLPAKNPSLAKAWLYANLIVALVVEDLAGQVLDSPPSGPAGDAAAGFPMAPVG